MVPFTLCPEEANPFALLNSEGVITLEGNRPSDKIYKVYGDTIGNAEELLLASDRLKNRMNTKKAVGMWVGFYTSHVEPLMTHSKIDNPSVIYDLLWSLKSLEDITMMVGIGRRLLLTYNSIGAEIPGADVLRRSSCWDTAKEACSR